jgi:hypothetical protein
MKTRILAAALVATAFATPALADFFVVREGASGPVSRGRYAADRHEDGCGRKQSVHGTCGGRERNCDGRATGATAKRSPATLVSRARQMRAENAGASGVLRVPATLASGAA